MSDLSTHSRIEAERKAAQPDAALVRTFRAYARGKQRGTLTAGQAHILRGLLAHRFADNVCAMVLDQVAARLQLARFAVEGDRASATAAAAVETALRELWTTAQIPALAGAAHYATLRDGNHAIALGWEGGRVRLARERWWNGKSGLFVAYDDGERPRYAVKDWEAPEGLRRTIWYADRIERYLAQGDGWRPYRLPEDGDVWPVPWLDRAGAPLGIPVVHLACRERPSDGDQADDPAPAYGVSILDGGVLGLQDEINDVQRDISAAARFAGYQMLWGTGITPQRDAEGNEVPLIVEPGAFFRDENPDAAFGTFPAGSLSELERTLTIKLQAVSRQTAVPQHLISGQWPSGEALLRAERPLTDRCEALIRVIGPSWSSIAHKATLLLNCFGGYQLDPTLLITSVFAPAERRDPLTRATVATAEAPFVSRRETLRTLGRSPAEIERILAELKEEASAAIAVPLIATNGGNG
jgi:hypothetical protein